MSRLMWCAVPLLWACKDAPADDSGADDSAPPDDSDTPPLTGWDWCPSEGGQGLGEGGELRVTGAALYCGASSEGRALTEEVDFKTQLYVPPNTLSLPDEDTSGAFLLPACLRTTPDGQGPVSAGLGEVTVWFDDYGTETWHNITLTQPMVDGEGQLWTLTLTSWGVGDLKTLLLDGDYHQLEDEGAVYMSACPGEGECEDYLQNRELLSCTFASEDSDHHTFTFEGGTLELDLRIGSSMASTEPAMLVRGWGTLDGVDFEQSDYWALVYNPDHHHFNRRAQVWLPDPIGEVCALQVVDFDPWTESPPTTITALGCDGASLGERTLLDEQFERVP